MTKASERKGFAELHGFARLLVVLSVSFHAFTRECSIAMVAKKTQLKEAEISRKGGPRVRIQDVALAAGVGTSSVSNYLNNRMQRLSPETRNRIAEAIEKLDFRPNQAAQQLKTGKKNVIAVVSPSIVNPFLGEMVFAIEQVAFRSGYGVYLCNSMRDPLLEKRFLDNLAGSGVGDLITVAPLLTRRGPYHAGNDDLNIVAIDASRADMGLARVDTINVDHEAAIVLAVEHLHELGHRRIAYVTDPVITFSRAMRLKSYRDSMARYGLSDVSVISVERTTDVADVYMVEVGRDAASQIAAANPRPTAAVAFNDMIALGLITGLRAEGISVPGDLSVVGIDDIWAGQLFSPPLTTVRQPIESMAGAAVERIVSPDKTQIGAGSDTKFQPALIVRETTAEPSSGAARSARRALRK
jgi:DNA-binding LacI/PurR family transcriptional regulator